VTGANRRPERIRPMTAADVEPAADVLLRGDFGDRRGFFAWSMTQPTIAPFVAEAEGRIVGTGVASVHGPGGWVGVIFVDPSRRGAGLGRRITETVVDHLEAQGVRSMVLIASPMGRPLYERLGFRVFERQVRFTIDGLPPEMAPADPRVRAFEPADLEAVLRLDREATGEDRAAVIRELVTPETAFVAIGDAGDVRGYLARAPWRGGAVVAPDPEDALRLLERRRYATGVSGKAGAGVLSCNEAGRARLRDAGWTEELGGVRMLRGDSLDWNPNAIYGQFNGALG
jgi:ribosomal protein S18 acetylase RimI-like enzyme